MKRGDIYFVSLDPSFGHEQQGNRPVLIVSTEAFNRVTNAPIVLPVTNGGGFATRISFAVALPKNMRTTGIVRCDQPRVADLAARGARFVESAPEEVVEDALELLISLFDPEEA